MTALSLARETDLYLLNLHATGLLFPSFPPAGCSPFICTHAYFPIVLLLLESLRIALCFHLSQNMSVVAHRVQ